MLLICRDRTLLETVCWHLAALPDSGVLLWSDVDAVAEENHVSYAEAEDGRCATVPLAATEGDVAYLTEYFEKEIAAGDLEIRSSQWTTAEVLDPEGIPQTVTVAGVDWPAGWRAKLEQAI